MNERVMGADAVRSDWRDVLDDVAGGDTILVERYRKPIAVVISYEDFVAVRDQLEELHDMRLAEQAYAEYKKDPSRARPIEELMAEWAKRDAAADTDEDAKATGVE